MKEGEREKMGKYSKNRTLRRSYLVERPNPLLSSIGFEVPHNHLFDKQPRSSTRRRCCTTAAFARVKFGLIHHRCWGIRRKKGDRDGKGSGSLLRRGKRFQRRGKRKNGSKSKTPIFLFIHRQCDRGPH